MKRKEKENWGTVCVNGCMHQRLGDLFIANFNLRSSTEISIQVYLEAV
jgi:hypothetical protein